MELLIIQLKLFPTNINNVAGHSKDTARNAGYGKIGAMADQLPKQFGEGLEILAVSFS